MPGRTRKATGNELLLQETALPIAFRYPIY